MASNIAFASPALLRRSAAAHRALCPSRACVRMLALRVRSRDLPSDSGSPGPASPPPSPTAPPPPPPERAPRPASKQAAKQVPPAAPREDARFAQVVLKRGRSAHLRGDRSCLVFSGAVARVVRRAGAAAPAAAEPVAVVDGAGAHVGFGFYNPNSMFAVRLLTHAPLSRSRGNELAAGVAPRLPDFHIADVVAERVRDAFAVRDALGLPSDDTSVFRAINGEADGLSGLAVDVFGNTAVVVSSSLWTERFQAEIRAALETSLRDHLQGDDGAVSIMWRASMPRLRQDGAGDVNNENKHFFPALLSGDEVECEQESAIGEESSISVKEHGIEYVLPASTLRLGQKSGFYADQRENRLVIRQLLSRRKGASVLDCYCYSGGFAISAALGGAKRVVAVDSSAPSLEMARANAGCNGVSENITFEKADVPSFLSDAAERGETWDVVVVDPPKLAPNLKSLDRASHKYRQINQFALKVVAKNGLLLTCSCSGAMTKNRDVFMNAVRKAASNAGREIVLLETRGAAPDHPVDMSEGAVGGGYLTALLFAVL